MTIDKSTTFQLKIYGHVKNEQTGSIEVCKMFFVGLNMVAFVFTQARIELDNYKSGDYSSSWILYAKRTCLVSSNQIQSEQDQAPVVNNDYQYKVDVGRIVILLTAMVAIHIYLAHALHNTSRLAFMVHFTIVYNIVPFLAVAKHTKMKKMSIATLKTLFDQ